MLIHGGGWTLGSSKIVKPLEVRLEENGWKVRSSDPPLYPNASAYTQQQWALRKIREVIRVDNPRKLIIIGGSSGGQIALKVAEKIEDIDLVVGISSAINTCTIRSPFNKPHQGMCELNKPDRPLVDVLLIHGQVDRLTPLKFVRRYANRYDKVYLQILRDKGHSLFRDPGFGVIWERIRDRLIFQRINFK